MTNLLSTMNQACKGGTKLIRKLINYSSRLLEMPESVTRKPGMSSIFSLLYSENINRGDIIILEKKDNRIPLKDLLNRTGTTILSSCKATKNQIIIARSDANVTPIPKWFDPKADKPWESRRDEILFQDGYVSMGSFNWKVVDFHSDSRILDGISIIPDGFGESFKGVLFSQKLVAKGLMVTKSEMLKIINSTQETRIEHGLDEDDDFNNLYKEVESMSLSDILVGKGAFKYGYKSGSDGLTVIHHDTFSYRYNSFNIPKQWSIFYNIKANFVSSVKFHDKKWLLERKFKDDFYIKKKFLLENGNIIYRSDLSNIVRSHIEMKEIRTNGISGMVFTLPLPDNVVMGSSNCKWIGKRVLPVRFPIYWTYSHNIHKVVAKGFDLPCLCIGPEIMELADGDNDGDSLFLFDSNKISLEFNPIGEIVKDLPFPSTEKVDDCYEPVRKTEAIMERQRLLSSLAKRIRYFDMNKISAGIAKPDVVIGSLESLIIMTHGLKHGVSEDEMIVGRHRIEIMSKYNTHSNISWAKRNFPEYFSAIVDSTTKIIDNMIVVDDSDSDLMGCFKKLLADKYISDKDVDLTDKDILRARLITGIQSLHAGNNEITPFGTRGGIGALKYGNVYLNTIIKRSPGGFKKDWYNTPSYKMVKGLVKKLARTVSYDKLYMAMREISKPFMVKGKMMHQAQFVSEVFKNSDVKLSYFFGIHPFPPSLDGIDTKQTYLDAKALVQKKEVSEEEYAKSIRDLVNADVLDAPSNQTTYEDKFVELLPAVKIVNNTNTERFVLSICKQILERPGDFWDTAAGVECLISQYWTIARKVLRLPSVKYAVSFRVKEMEVLIKDHLEEKVKYFAERDDDDEEIEISEKL